MNLERIAIQFINDNGFDGLVNASMACGCSKEDLAPCGQPNMSNCEAAYKSSKPSLGLGADQDEYYSTEK